MKKFLKTSFKTSQSVSVGVFLSGLWMGLGEGNCGVERTQNMRWGKGPGWKRLKLNMVDADSCEKGLSALLYMSLITNAHP